MEWLFVVKHLLAHLLLPPIGLVWLALAGLMMRRRLGAAATAMATGGLVLVLLASTPVISGSVLGLVESRGGPAFEIPKAAARADAASAPQAIVVLGGGLSFDARERPGPLVLGALTEARVVHGARLARRTQLPVAVTGGKVIYMAASEAALMARTMREDFDVAPRWIEDSALDTRDNANRTAALMAPAGVRRILLVTHAYHMARARYAFERAGFVVTPAPFDFMGGQGDVAWLRWLPSAGGATLAWLAAHEVVGELWYRLADILDRTS